MTYCISAATLTEAVQLPLYSENGEIFIGLNGAHGPCRPYSNEWTISNFLKHIFKNVLDILSFKLSFELHAIL